jgi:cytochrome c-type biogenesis protein CcmH
MPDAVTNAARPGSGSALRARLPRSRLLWAFAILPAVLAVGLYAMQRDAGGVRDPSDRIAPAAEGPRAPTVREDLAALVARNPGDGRAWVLLARAEFEADRFAPAAAAYERAVAASSKVARDPAVWCEYADALGMAQGGSLAGAPREFIARALEINPAHPKALEMAGSAAYEARDHELAATYWRELLVQLPARTRERGELEAAITRADELARRR